jgi:hypothetical protein
MNEERKLLWPRIAALLIGLPVLYVGSFGPACWLADRHTSAWSPVWNAYYPLNAAAVRGPRFFFHALIDYGCCGSPASIPIAFELSCEATVNVPRH